ncbi:MAG: DUF2752 domain-containing protein [Clostridia bacterium]|nr:DUF2752 domain-containing protein [Clostridia bacterium]
MESERKFYKKVLLLLLFLPFLALLYALFYLGCTRAGLSLFQCKIARSLGFYCPGCGGSRAVVALLALHPLRAFVLHPAVPIAALCLFFALLRVSLFLLGKGRAPRRRFWLSILFLCMGAILLQCAVKNILLFHGVDIIGDIL